MRASSRPWSDVRKAGGVVNTTTSTSDEDVVSDDEVAFVMPQRQKSTATLRWRRRGCQLAALGGVLAALVVLVVLMLLRTSDSTSVSLPRRFSSSVVVYEKLPNGTVEEVTPWMTGELHRDGDEVRATGVMVTADEGQHTRFHAVNARAAYEVFFGTKVFEDEEAEPEDNDDVERDSVSCLLKGDAPAASDATTAFSSAVVVDEEEMLQVVGPGGCEGDRVRIMATVAGIQLVICQVDNLQYQIVGTGFVAYMDATGTVDTNAMAAIALPTADDGSDLDCPELDGFTVPEVTMVAASRRRRLTELEDCMLTANNSPPPGNCASLISEAQLATCGGLHNTLHGLTGMTPPDIACVLPACSSWDDFLRSIDVPRLCSPMPNDSRRLGKASKKDRNMLRVKVAPSSRITKCVAKGRQPTKRCLFVHGVGAPSPSAAFGSSLRSRFPFYWGPVHHYVKKSCTDVEFVHLPTATLPWDSEELARHFCYWATPATEGKSLSDPTFGTIDDTVLFAHGAGNLIIANAERLGLCSRAPSTYWFEAQEGFHLGRLAKWNMDFCSEVAADADGDADELDAELARAYDKRMEFMGAGAPSSWKHGDKSGWRKWRREWRKSFDKPTWRRLRLRQLRRRANRRLGLCKHLDTAPLSFPLSKYTFEPSDGWRAILSDGSEAGTFDARDESVLKAVSNTIINGVDGSMCGDLSDNARHRAKFVNIKPEAWHEDYQRYSRPWSRCWARDLNNDIDDFQANPRFKSYSAPTSFYELTCRFGNPKGEGGNGINRPCDWYNQMACFYASTGDYAPPFPAPVEITDDDFVSDADAADLEQEESTEPDVQP